MKSKRTKCLCGCGKLANPGYRYIYGHQRIGSKISKKQRESMVAGMPRGSDNHNWQGGKENRNFGESGYWVEVKKVKERDKGKCAVCDRKKDKNHRLDIHHVVPVRIGRDSKLCHKESNLITLCTKCHGKADMGNTNKWKEFLPTAYKYLKRFKYKHLLLRKYYKPGK